MTLELVGHGGVVEQVHAVFEADPKDGPLGVARIKALLEAYDDDPNLLEPAPVSQQVWSEGVTLNMRRGASAELAVSRMSLAIYVYETWRLRFGLARLALRGKAIVGALLMVETRAAGETGMSSCNLCHSLLAQAEEIIWPN